MKNIIYFFALDSYPYIFENNNENEKAQSNKKQKNKKNNSKTSIEDSLKLLKKILKKNEGKINSVIILFTRTDHFGETLKNYPIVDIFPDYNGTNETKEVLDYFEYKFNKVITENNIKAIFYHLDQTNLDEYLNLWKIIEKKYFHKKSKEKNPTINKSLINIGTMKGNKKKYFGESWIEHLILNNYNNWFLINKKQEMFEKNFIIIYKALRQDISLQKLDLSNCNLNATLLQQLFKGLSTRNTNLNNLNLSHNRFEQDSWTLICEFLLYDRSLKKLSLANTNLNEITSIELSKIIKKNNSLISLNIQYNKITKKGVVEIFKSLEFNKTLKNICMDGIKFNKLNINEIKKLLKYNLAINNKYQFNDKRQFFEAKFKNNKLMEIFTYKLLIKDETYQKTFLSMKDLMLFDSNQFNYLNNNEKNNKEKNKKKKKKKNGVKNKNTNEKNKENLGIIKCGGLTLNLEKKKIITNKNYYLYKTMCKMLLYNDYPETGFISLILGWSYFRLNNPVKAFFYFEKSIFLNNVTINSFAIKYRKKNNKKLLQTKIDSKDTYIYQLNKGKYFLLKKNYYEALNYFNKSIKLNPHNVEAIIGKSKCLMKFKNLKKALRNIDFAIILDKNNIEAINLKARMYTKIEKYQESLLLYEKVLAINENHIGSIYGIGNIFYHLNKFQLAVKEFERALAFKPNFVKCQRKKILALVEREKKDNKVFENQENKENLIRSLQYQLIGLCKLKNWLKIKKICKKILKIHSSNWFAILFLILSYQLINRITKKRKIVLWKKNFLKLINNENLIRINHNEIILFFKNYPIIDELIFICNELEEESLEGEFDEDKSSDQENKEYGDENENENENENGNEEGDEKKKNHNKKNNKKKNSKKKNNKKGKNKNDKNRKENFNVNDLQVRIKFLKLILSKIKNYNQNSLKKIKEKKKKLIIQMIEKNIAIIYYYLKKYAKSLNYFQKNFDDNLMWIIKCNLKINSNIKKNDQSLVNYLNYLRFFSINNPNDIDCLQLYIKIYEIKLNYKLCFLFNEIILEINPNFVWSRMKKNKLIKLLNIKFDNSERDDKPLNKIILLESGTENDLDDDNDSDSVHLSDDENKGVKREEKKIEGVKEDFKNIYKNLDVNSNMNRKELNNLLIKFKKNIKNDNNCDPYLFLIFGVIYRQLDNLTKSNFILKKLKKNLINLVNSKKPNLNYEKIFLLCYKEIGINYFFKKKYQKAILYFNKSLELESNHKDFSNYYYRAFCFKKMKNYQHSIIDFKTCNLIKPNDYTVLYQICKYYFLQNKLNKGLKYYNKLISLNSQFNKINKLKIFINNQLNLNSPNKNLIIKKNDRENNKRNIKNDDENNDHDLVNVNDHDFNADKTELNEQNLIKMREWKNKAYKLDKKSNQQNEEIVKQNNFQLLLLLIKFVMNIVDITTDIILIVSYILNKENNFAILSGVILFFSTLIISYVSSSKREIGSKWKYFLIGIFQLTITTEVYNFFKTNNKMKLESLEKIQDFSLYESILESLPQSLLQSYILLNNLDLANRNTIIVSLVISILFSLLAQIQSSIHASMSILLKILIVLDRIFIICIRYSFLIIITVCFQQYSFIIFGVGILIRFLWKLIDKIVKNKKDEKKYIENGNEFENDIGNENENENKNENENDHKNKIMDDYNLNKLDKTNIKDQIGTCLIKSVQEFFIGTVSTDLDLFNKDKTHNFYFLISLFECVICAPIALLFQSKHIDFLYNNSKLFLFIIIVLNLCYIFITVILNIHLEREKKLLFVDPTIKYEKKKFKIQKKKEINLFLDKIEGLDEDIHFSLIWSLVLLALLPTLILSNVFITNSLTDIKLSNLQIFFIFSPIWIAFVIYIVFLLFQLLTNFYLKIIVRFFKHLLIVAIVALPILLLHLKLLNVIKTTYTVSLLGFLIYLFIAILTLLTIILFRERVNLLPDLDSETENTLSINNDYFIALHSQLTALFFFLSFILFLIFLSLSLDKVIQFNWATIFTPLFIFNIIHLIFTFMPLCCLYKNSKQRRGIFYIHLFIFICFIIPLSVFEILLALTLTKTYIIKFSIILIPIYVLFSVMFLLGLFFVTVFLSEYQKRSDKKMVFLDTLKHRKNQFLLEEQQKNEKREKMKKISRTKTEDINDLQNNVLKQISNSSSHSNESHHSDSQSDELTLKKIKLNFSNDNSSNSDTNLNSDSDSNSDSNSTTKEPENSDSGSGSGSGSNSTTKK
ncbi:glycoprotein 96-92-related-related [Anaeramoeba flamelloides]|uniref:Glycoprotein 96-92-related-related n=1 Tax=Anaeramoeba flamelloides TaxID=1746091 RepID=A0AAV7YW52_9EUKA|nr:glycoprotein 96-92-related-related [Anaeramoeba flamelloides]